jgi:tetratricopeptide (TPR) repeat protein
MKKIGIISSLAIVIITSVVFGAYKYTKNNEYNDLIESANMYMEKGEYDKAIDLFKQSLSYKDDENIENSIKLTESLAEIKNIYYEGIKLMDEKKYLEAIEQFKQIGTESDEFYKEAQDRINECNEEYIALNISEASISLEADKYDEANKYIEEVLKIDKDNEEAKNLKDIIDKKIQEQGMTQGTKQEENIDKVDYGEITSSSAENIVKNLVAQYSSSNIMVRFDHEETRDGINYFVIQVYENMGDHIATSGWYYVNENDGQVFDGTFGDLVPVE